MLLRTIDSLWVEHLTELDDMRRGIGLRGYAQQDPLNEFRREAYRLYEELSGLIQRQVATTIFRVTVRREPETVPLPGPGQPARLDGAAAPTTGTGAAIGAQTNGTNGSDGSGGAAARPPRPARPSRPAAPRSGDRRRRPWPACRPTRCAGPARCRVTRRRPAASARASPRRGPGSGATNHAGADRAQKYKKCHGA